MNRIFVTQNSLLKQLSPSLVFVLTSILSLGYSLIMPLPAYASTRYESGISTNATLLWMNDRNLNARLGDIKSLNVTWIRVDFSWPAIQAHNQNEYRWEKYDRVVHAAGAHHLKILAVLDYTPKWARDFRCQSAANNEKSAQKCSPKDRESFGRFARAAASRYHNQSVRGWEIWNEPNLNAYWRTVQPDGSLFVDPVEYARIANIAAAQIRRYTDAAIITGGLSPLFEPSRSTGMRQSDFATQMLPYLRADLFNGVGLHPYSWPLLPSRAASFNAFYTVNNGPADSNVREIMDTAGWSNKQIWGTEYGASTSGISHSAHISKNSRPDHVTEDTQAQIVAQGMEDWYIKPSVGPLFIHSDSDQWLSSHRNEGGFGLRRRDGTRKPAYDAFKVATEQLQLKNN
jgi:hypothetical protein